VRENSAKKAGNIVPKNAYKSVERKKVSFKEVQDGSSHL
jgi:hypothetical protein